MTTYPMQVISTISASRITGRTSLRREALNEWAPERLFCTMANATRKSAITAIGLSKASDVAQEVVPS